MGSRYYTLLTAYLTSSLGNWLYRLALPLLVLKLTGSALSTGAVYAVEYIPFLLLSLPGGVFADRFDRRRLLIFGDMTAAVIATALAVVVSTGSTALWPIYLTAFLLACVEPVYHPAFQSFLPEVVPADRLGPANSWMHSGDNVMSMIGPAAAGGLVMFLGYQTTIYVNAATFVVSAIAILLIRPTAAKGERTPPPKATFIQDVRVALRYVFRRNPVLAAGSLMFTGTNFAIWLIQANFIFYLTTYRHMSPQVIGVVLAAQGVGAVLGAAVAGRLVQKYPPGRILITTTAVAGLGTLLLIPARGPLAIGAIWGALYALGSINPVAWFTLRQKIVPRELLGRVVASTRMLAFASIPVSALLAGALESAFHNMYLIIVVGGLLRLAIAGVAWLSPLRTPVEGVIEDEPGTPGTQARTADAEKTS
ncbi:MFS transporter [Streptomyces sp. ISL-66]|uniref:MFS transporter n=1 Tax=Streptomyces sp. ISL-66 TaxID=2819186 RepID=UPI001BE83CB2|nr:MFS transporter [Streptomyces sp. ISL-66]MBT2468527.1 MFS transporter [Streptomyces sp. ISL-66]